MTSVCPQRVRFRNCLAIQSGTRSFSPGEQTFAWGVCVSSSPPAPHCRCSRKSPGRRVRRAAPACQWQPCILEEVGSCPEYFSYGAPPLESAAADFYGRWSWDGGVGAAVKNETGDFSSLGWRRGKRGRPFFHLLQFHNQTHPRQPREERPKGETRSTRSVSPTPRSQGRRRRAHSWEKGSRFWVRPPPRRTGDSGQGARSEAAAALSAVLLAGSAEVRRAGAGNKGAEWGGEPVGRGRAPGCQKVPPGGSPSVT